jgi:hypothetical protein
MSDYALLSGVQTYLRSLDLFDETNCGVQIDERPPPVIPDFYASIHMIETRTGKFDDGGLIEEIYVFGVTVSKRIKAVPRDRIAGDVYIEQLAGLSRICRYVVAALHHRASPIITANTLVDDEDNAGYLAIVAGEKFINVPTWIGTTGVPQLHNEEWFHGTYNTRNARMELPGFVGMSKTCRFRVTKVTKQKDNC